VSYCFILKIVEIRKLIKINLIFSLSLKETPKELLYLTNYMTLDKKKQSLIILTDLSL